MTSTAPSVTSVFVQAEASASVPDNGNAQYPEGLQPRMPTRPLRVTILLLCSIASLAALARTVARHYRYRTMDASDFLLILAAITLLGAFAYVNAMQHQLLSVVVVGSDGMPADPILAIENMVAHVLTWATIYSIKGTLLALCWGCAKKSKLTIRLWWAACFVVPAAFAVTLSLSILTGLAFHRASPAPLSASIIRLTAAYLFGSTVLDTFGSVMLVVMLMNLLWHSTQNSFCRTSLIGALLISIASVATSIVRVALAQPPEDSSPAGNSQDNESLFHLDIDLSWILFWQFIEATLGVTIASTLMVKNIVPKAQANKSDEENKRHSADTAGSSLNADQTDNRVLAGDAAHNATRPTSHHGHSHYGSLSSWFSSPGPATPKTVQTDYEEYLAAFPSVPRPPLKSPVKSLKSRLGYASSISISSLWVSSPWKLSRHTSARSSFEQPLRGKRDEFTNSRRHGVASGDSPSHSGRPSEDLKLMSRKKDGTSKDSKATQLGSPHSSGDLTLGVGNWEDEDAIELRQQGKQEKPEEQESRSVGHSLWPQRKYDRENEQLLPSPPLRIPTAGSPKNPQMENNLAANKTSPAVSPATVHDQNQKEHSTSTTFEVKATTQTTPPTSNLDTVGSLLEIGIRRPRLAEHSRLSHGPRIRTTSWPRQELDSGRRHTSRDLTAVLTDVGTGTLQLQPHLQPPQQHAQQSTGQHQHQRQRHQNLLWIPQQSAAGAQPPLVRSSSSVCLGCSAANCPGNRNRHRASTLATSPSNNRISGAWI